ncbi:MAG: hypothetical protein HRU70_08620 [Phycisphaeraceae bacterium]|nr:MAG: hypothetical protein HRU70_08620 [Phycisphaeraceae bacterium]
MNTRTNTALVASIVLSASAAVGACFVAAQKPCCSLLTNNFKPNPEGPCPDNITSNPTVDHFNIASPGQPGKKSRISVNPGPDCVWDVYSMNGEGNCILIVEGRRTHCTPITVAGASCTGEAQP